MHSPEDRFPAATEPWGPGGVQGQKATFTLKLTWWYSFYLYSLKPTATSKVSVQ